jgi:hypothetical protein
MKERKPRTKEQSFMMNKKCMYYDGKTEDGTHIHECMFPWNGKCEGDRHKCFKLKLHWLASLPDEKRKIMQDKYSL